MVRLRPRLRFFRLRFLLLLSNLVVLALPLAGIFALRIYESALIRQTESALISQGSFVSAAYRQTVKRLSASQAEAEPLKGARIKGEASSLLKEYRAQLDLARSPVLAPLAEPPRASVLEIVRMNIIVGGQLEPIILDSQQSLRANINLLDAKGRVLASNQYDLGTDLSARADVAAALSGTPTSSLYAKKEQQAGWFKDYFVRGEDLRVHVSLPVILGQNVAAVVTLSRTPSSIVDTLSGKTFELTIAGLLVLVLLVALSLFTSFTISQPLHRLAEQAAQVASGKRSDFRGAGRLFTYELARLSQALTKMTQTLSSRTAYIRQFTAHLSHELKSPLTAIQGSVELMQDDAAMPAAVRQQFLGNIARDVHRLRRLVARVLELSRAETLDAEPRGCVPLGLVWDEIEQRYGSEDRIVLKSPEQKVLNIPMSREGLYSVLSNLVDNALKHGQPPVRLWVEVAGQEQVRFYVQDQGLALSADEFERALEPFYTSARDTGGTGLGLPLVSALLRNAGGRLDYQRDAEQGGVFVVTLPLL